jgi:hypothetical protein
VRGRREWWIAAAVATTMVVAAVVIVVQVVHRAGEPEPLPGPVPVARLAQPATRFWPGAVHRLPATLPDGSRYGVAAVLGGDRYLVTDATPGPVLVAVYDVGAHALRVLGRQPGVTLFGRPAVAGDLVSWASTGPEHGTEIWAARLSGAEPVRLAQLPSVADSGRVPIDGPRPVGDTVLWTRFADRPDGQPVGVFRVPAAGGTPALVPGTAGYALVTGAWARADGGDLRNVLTGERVALPASVAGLTCGPAWCAGPGAERFAYAVVHADGTGGPTELDRPYRLVAGGRVAVAVGQDKHGDRQGLVVWNPATGVWGALDGRYALPHGDDDLDLAVLTAADGGRLDVFDLTTVAG